jgi:hypothetical protein
MGLSWSRSRARQHEQSARRADIEIARYLAEDVRRRSSAAIAADMARAVAEYRGPVRRLPYIMKLKCICGHKGRVKVYPGARKRFRCSKCGFLSI